MTNILLRPAFMAAAISGILLAGSPAFAASVPYTADLKGSNLLRVAHAAEDWPLWLKAADVPRIVARGTEFQYYGQALQAAIDGLGCFLSR